MCSPYLPSQDLILNPQLMVIDDEPSSAKIIQKYLRDAGYEDVIITCDPTEAMGIIADKQPDLLLLDIMMPKVSGLDILQAVRSGDRFPHLPVIILTASTDRDIKIRALELGVTDFLPKPPDPVELLPRIRNALSIKALRQHYERTKAAESAGDDATVEVQTDRAHRPHSPAELCPSQLSWPVLQETSFQELKSTAKVMIIDDEPINIKVVRKYLSHEGYTDFVTISDATEATETIQREAPDVILLDIMMPGMSGLEILEKVRADKRFMDLPVIILTAATDHATKQQALNLGATEFLTKPIDPTEVLPRVRNALVVKAHQDHVKAYARELESRVSQHVAKMKGYSAALEKANEVLRRSQSAAQAANRAKSQFLANMSHEIRTPLTAMIGFAEVMLDESDSKAMSAQDIAHLNTIVCNGRHLLEVINDILDLSKIEAGQLELEIISCSPYQLLTEVLQSMQAQAASRGLSLQAECATPLPEFIRTDPTCLRRILVNLIGNAVKFTENGSVRVVVSLVGEDDSGRSLQFEVVDSGIGISREQLDKLFQPFVQADVSVTRRFGGTGLGLTISKQLADKLGGSIAVQSELGCGSTFRVVIPVGSLDNVKIVKEPLIQEGKVGEEGRGNADHARLERLDCRILLAEDSVDSQRLISLILRKAGAEVVTVNNGQAAYEQAMEAQESGRPFDIVLMDMQMPVLDGYAATRRLRDEGFSLPIIALTAHAMKGEREKCLAAGCDDYATKPISREGLLDAIAQHVSQSTETESVPNGSQSESGSLS